MNNTKILLLLIIFASIILISQACLQLVYQWKDLEFRFPSAAQEQDAIQTKKYIRGNGVPIDVQPYYGYDALSVFVTVPRFTTGIPFSLAVVSSSAGPNGPYLLPYPNYDWHSSHGSNCDGITSVFRVAIDPCQKLWVLDSGKIGSVQHCPPQLLVFNLNSNTLVRRYRFPSTQYYAKSLFITPIVDTRDSYCQNTMVYIADVLGFGILVYDYAANKSWRTEHSLMQPLQQSSNFTIAGESFTLMDGVFGLSVTPPSFTSYGNRVLYFHALASYKENAVPLYILDDCRYWTNVNSMQDKFQTIGQRTTQAVAMAMDSQGHLFAGPIYPIGISSWYIAQPYSTHYMVYKNAVTLQFISGMKVTRNTYGQEELWVNSNRFQKIMAGTKNINEINFRIQGQLTQTILSGNCY